MANRKAEQVGGTQGMAEDPVSHPKTSLCGTVMVDHSLHTSAVPYPYSFGVKWDHSVQHEGHLALAVIQRILLFMVLLLVILLVLRKAQGDAGSDSSIYTAVIGIRSKTHNSFLILHYEAFCCLSPCGCN